MKAGREAKDLWKRLDQDIALARADVRGTRRRRGSRSLRLPLRRDPPSARRGRRDEARPRRADARATTLPRRRRGRRQPRAAPADRGRSRPHVRRRARPATACSRPPRRPAAKADAAPEPKPVAPLPPAAAGSRRRAAAAAAAAAAREAADAASRPASQRAGLPPNPETAELEKSDPRHAAARRLARLSVSEIKLYHEDEVKAGREAKDLWKRMITDIGLAIADVREARRQGGPRALRLPLRRDPPPARRRRRREARTGGAEAEEGRAATAAPAAEARQPAPAPAPCRAPRPRRAAPAARPPLQPRPRRPRCSRAAPAAAAPAAPAPAAPPRPRRRRGYAPPTNPATAELEKNDPRHAAARRLARLSVSEIKLYHEDEVKAGREAKDLWKRLHQRHRARDADVREARRQGGPRALRLPLRRDPPPARRGRRGEARPRSARSRRPTASPRPTTKAVERRYGMGSTTSSNRPLSKGSPGASSTRTTRSRRPVRCSSTARWWQYRLLPALLKSESAVHVQPALHSSA